MSKLAHSCQETMDLIEKAIDFEDRRMSTRDRHKDLTDRLRELDDYFNVSRPDDAQTRAMLDERDLIIASIEKIEADIQQSH